MAIARCLLVCASIAFAGCATAPHPQGPGSAADSNAAPSLRNADDPTYPLTTDIDPSIPSEYRTLIEQAQIEGMALFREDRAAWIATDAVVARGIVERNRNHASGWLATQLDPVGNEWNVAFTGSTDGHNFAYADVRVDFRAGNPIALIEESAPERDLSSIEEILAAGRDGFRNKEWLRCSATYNTSTQLFIDEGKEYVVVRMLPASVDANVRPMGGFHRLRVPLAGNAAVEHFSQTRSCLNDTTPPGEIFMMTLINSETPTEFDVFTSLSYQRPHYVATAAGAWAIEAGHIRWVGKSRGQ